MGEQTDPHPSPGPTRHVAVSGSGYSRMLRADEVEHARVCSLGNVMGMAHGPHAELSGPANPHQTQRQDPAPTQHRSSEPSCTPHGAAVWTEPQFSRVSRFVCGVGAPNKYQFGSSGMEQVRASAPCWGPRPRPLVGVSIPNSPKDPRRWQVAVTTRTFPALPAVPPAPSPPGSVGQVLPQPQPVFPPKLPANSRYTGQNRLLWDGS